MKAFGLANFLGATWLWWIVLITGAALGAFVTCAVRLAVGDGPKAPWAELITAFLAGLAFVIALATYRFTWMKSQNDLFGVMHDRLLSPEVQTARKFLSNATKEQVGDLFLPGNRQHEIINHTLALYETFSMYAEKRLVNPALYEEMWGQNLRSRRQTILWFLEFRKDKDGFESWPHLRRFLK